MKPYWTDGKRSLYCGDARDLLKKLPPAELLFTDPPNEMAGWDGLLKIQPAALLVNLGTVRTWMESEPQALTVWQRPSPTSQGFPCDMLLHFAMDAPHIPFIKDTAPRQTDHSAERGLAPWTRVMAAYEPASVLDPFCGSGTTLLAARELDIEAIGIEADETFCEMAVKRLTA